VVAKEWQEETDSRMGGSSTSTMVLKEISRELR